MGWLLANMADSPVPRHVAFIMDGNRRWAHVMGHAEETTGHEFGAARGEEVLEWCRAAKIHHVTVYVASLDNLRKRSSKEVSCLMNLIERFVAARLVQRDCHLHVAGRIEYLPSHTAGVLRQACEASAGFLSEFHLTAAIAYDGQTEIVDAVRSWLREEATAGATLEQLAHTLSVEDISAHLYTKDQPHPELVIRTGGDLRLSCFMPWQTAHSYLYFSKAYWPALTKAEFLHAMSIFAESRLRGQSKMGRLRTPGGRALAIDEIRRCLFDLTSSVRKNPALQEFVTLQRPKHVAIVLAGDDFGGAKTRSGHPGIRLGDSVVNIEELLSWCKEFEIETVTLGLLAADQLSQPAEDVRNRLEDLVAVLEQLSNSPIKPRLRLCGLPGLLPEPTSSRIAEAIARTTAHTGPTTNVAICYDGRSEVVQAVREVLAKQAAQGRSLDDMPDRLEVDDIARILCTSGEPDLDLIIVVSSRPALNGFLLWQAVRSEFWFWKGGSRFRRVDFMDALRDFGLRSRRFGA